MGAESAASGAHQKAGTVVVASPDGRHVATGGRDGDVILTACADFREVRRARMVEVRVRVALRVGRCGRTVGVFLVLGGQDQRTAVGDRVPGCAFI